MQFPASCSPTRCRLDFIVPLPQILPRASNRTRFLLKEHIDAAHSFPSRTAQFAPPSRGRRILHTQSAPWPLAQTESIVYSFNGVSGGANPTSQLIADKAGNLYGTTLGPSDGTVFELIRLTGGQVEEVTLHSFSGSDGSGPLGGLVMDSKGNLYGTTYEGGNYGSGVVYELQPTATGSWDFTVIHNFHYDGVSNFDGLHPAATLVLDGKGNLYGTTEIGGTGLCNEATDTINRTVSPPKGGSSYSCGTVFEVSPQKGGNWSEQVIHNFQGTDGGLPLASMIFDRGGNLFAHHGLGQL